jgi:hypothetical protein
MGAPEWEPRADRIVFVKEPGFAGASFLCDLRLVVLPITFHKVMKRSCQNQGRL